MKDLTALFCLLFACTTLFAQDDVETITSPLKSMQGHEADVNCVAYSPDGNKFATGGRKSRVIVWDANNHNKLMNFKPLETGVFSIAFSPDSKFLAVSGNDLLAKIYNLETGDMTVELPGHRSKVNDVTFGVAADGKYVATATKNGVIRVFNRKEDGKRLRKFEFEGVSAKSVDFHPSGRYLIAGCGDGSIKLMSFVNGEVEQTLKQHGDVVNAVDFTNNGDYFVSASSDQKALVWSYSSKTVEQELKGHTWRVLSADFNYNGKYIVTGSNDGSARIWDRESGKNIRVYEPDNREYFSDVAFKPNSKRFISSSMVRSKNDDCAKIWDTNLGPQGNE